LLGDIPGLGVLFRSTSNSIVKRNLIVFLRPTIMANNGRLVDVTRQRYLGVTALQFRMNRRGEMEQVVPYPLPSRVEQIFEGRSRVPEALQEHAEEHLFAPEDGPVVGE